jgi:uncharacterized YigZ family protein
MAQYKTVAQEAQIEIIEKKSRFIAQVFPVDSSEDCEAHLMRIKKQFWDARHHCMAYILGELGEIQRFSDDGEPQGTAGKPILEVLKGENLTNVLVVVTRYFGGTLLGTGGLVRAYGRAAKEGVVAAQMIKCVQVFAFKVTVPYTLTGKIQHLISASPYEIKSTEYLEEVHFRVEVPIAEEEKFVKWLIDQTHAEAQIEKQDRYYVNKPAE